MEYEQPIGTLFLAWLLIPTLLRSPVMGVRKDSFGGGDTTGIPRAGTPPEEGQLAKEPRSEWPATGRDRAGLGLGLELGWGWPTLPSAPLFASPTLILL